MNAIDSLKQLIELGSKASKPTYHDGWYAEGNDIVGYSEEKYGNAVIGTMCGDTAEQASANTNFVIAAGDFRDHAQKFVQAVDALRQCRIALAAVRFNSAHDLAFELVAKVLDDIEGV